MRAGGTQATGRILAAARRRPLLAALALALVIQMASATWWLKPYTMPNAALVIAYNVARTGRFEGGSWVRLKGTVRPTDPPLRSFHLPGEPLYLAAGLALRRPSIFTYWHVPVAVLLVVATAAAALALFGADAALVAGGIAALDPVMVIHGPVFDDLFLGAACLWAVAALCVARWGATYRSAGRRVPFHWTEAVALLVAAGWAAITRSELQVALAAAALACLALPALRPLRPAGAAIAAGVLLAVGAWGTRNVVTQHHLLLGSTHDGITLWEATEPHASDALVRGQVDALSGDARLMAPFWKETADLDEVGADRVFRRAAMAQLVSQPGRLAAFGVHKIGLSLVGLRPELPLSSARNVVTIATTVVLAGAAMLGLWWVGRTSRPELRVPAIAALLLGFEVLGVLALGPVGVRYWIIWRPVLWILAACAVVGVRRRFVLPAAPAVST